MQQIDPGAIAEALRLARQPTHTAHAAHGHVPMHKPQQDGMDFDGGLLTARGHGRTDTLPINVPSGAYVLPADVVSALGQGNTLAGAKALDDVFSSAPYRATHGPYSTDVPKGAHGHGPPHMANGGVARVPIIAAGGEYVVPPHVAIWIGEGDIKRGHGNLDKFVKMVRDKNVKTVSNLPGPQK